MKIPKYLLPFFFFCCILCFCGCNAKTPAPSTAEPPEYDSLHVLVPSADGEKTLGISPIFLDISNIEQGYMIAQSDSLDKKINIQLTGPDNILYSYFLAPKETAVIPFTSGEGSYQLLCYQQITADQYAALYSEVLEISLENPFLPFLYPNQYVNFNEENEAVQLAFSLLPADAGELETLSAVYDYVTRHITYDYDKAYTVENGYLPDIDETLQSETGICFDYAALMTAMLRSRGIPCKLQIGYNSDLKHAWIDVYIRSKGWINQAISFDGEAWNLMDPTFEASSQSSKEAQRYIGDGTSYTVQFSR